MLSERVIGKKAWVTGAAHGIGRASAWALAEAGADVAIVDLDIEEAMKRGWKRLLSILESLVEKHWSCQLTSRKRMKLKRLLIQ